MVKKEPLSKEVRRLKYRISKKYDQKYERRPVEEMLQLAEVCEVTCSTEVTWLCYKVSRSER